MRSRLAVALLALPAAGAQAQSGGTYAGTIACERMQGRAASNAPFQLVVEGGQAGYAREVLAVDGSPMGMPEEAKAPVAPDGALALAATIEAGSFHYEARYEGRLGEASGRLAGTQAWLLGKDRVERKCTITVSRRSAPTARRPARPTPAQESAAEQPVQERPQEQPRRARPAARPAQERPAQERPTPERPGQERPALNMNVPLDLPPPR